MIPIRARPRAEPGEKEAFDLYCGRCGSYLEENTVRKFCPACGAPLGGDDPAPQVGGPDPDDRTVALQGSAPVPEQAFAAQNNGPAPAQKQGSHHHSHTHSSEQGSHHHSRAHGDDRGEGAHHRSHSHASGQGSHRHTGEQPADQPPVYSPHTDNPAAYAPAPQADYAFPQPPTAPTAAPAPNKNTASKVLIIVAIVLVALAAVTLVLFMVFKFSVNESESSPEATQTAETAEASTETRAEAQTTTDAAESTTASDASAASASNAAPATTASAPNTNSGNLTAQRVSELYAEARDLYEEWMLMIPAEGTDEEVYTENGINFYHVKNDFFTSVNDLLAQFSIYFDESVCKQLKQLYRDHDGKLYALPGGVGSETVPDGFFLKITNQTAEVWTFTIHVHGHNSMTQAEVNQDFNYTLKNVNGRWVFCNPFNCILEYDPELLTLE